MTRKGASKDRGYSIHREPRSTKVKRIITIGLFSIVGILVMMFISSPRVFHMWING